MQTRIDSQEIKSTNLAFEDVLMVYPQNKWSENTTEEPNIKLISKDKRLKN